MMRIVLYIVAAVLAVLGLLTVVAVFTTADAQTTTAQGLGGAVLFFALAGGLVWLARSAGAPRD